MSSMSSIALALSGFTRLMRATAGRAGRRAGGARDRHNKGRKAGAGTMKGGRQGQGVGQARPEAAGTVEAGHEKQQVGCSSSADGKRGSSPNKPGTTGGPETQTSKSAPASCSYGTQVSAFSPPSPSPHPPHAYAYHVLQAASGSSAWLAAAPLAPAAPPPVPRPPPQKRAPGRRRARPRPAAPSAAPCAAGGLLQALDRQPGCQLVSGRESQLRGQWRGI